MTDSDLSIAVLVPCYNEGATITAVVDDFRKALPAATVYVYDNNSKDDTVNKAKAAGAVVRTETRQGKGHVVRRMFADIDADVYVLVDGDDTYEAAAAPKLVARLIDDGLDMVTGTRVAQSEEAYRTGHRFGNRLLTGLVAHSFGSEVSDMLSGYRVLSRRFVKSFPLLSGGFEIETEMTVHGLELGMPQAEVTTDYKERPEGSESKLNTYGDGFRILVTIIRMLKEERPIMFFGSMGAAMALLALILAVPIIVTFINTGLVPRFPTAILATGLMLLAFLSFACGLILATVTRGRQELKRLRYLQIPGVLARQDGD